MGKQLKLDEMLEVLTRLNHPQAVGLTAALESIGTHMANIIGEELCIRTDAATFQGLAFAGLCAPFFPRFDGQPVPEVLEDIDEGADWEFDAW